MDNLKTVKQAKREGILRTRKDPGRPKKGNVVCAFSLSPDTICLLEEVTGETSLDKSAYVERALRAQFEADGLWD
jgi:hypothetical protein